MKATTDENKTTKANALIFKALENIREAADVLGSTAAYYNTEDAQHGATVAKYNALISATLALAEYQTI